MGAVDNLLTQAGQVSYRPSLRIRRGIAEHVEEDGLGEAVEFREGGAALGPQLIRLVQDRCNPPLLGQRRQWDLDS